MKRFADSKWLEELVKTDFIDRFNTPCGNYYRLACCSFYFSDFIIQALKKEYSPDVEIGGFFLASPEKEDNSIIWIIKEIRFVKNISPTPHQTYIRDPDETNEVISYSLNKKLLPLVFHSHPTTSINLIGEAIEYNSQMDTSNPDKICSLFSRILIDETELRLPDILIVCNGQLKNGLFVGFYGGLIARLDFTERKQILKDDFANKIFDSLNRFFNTPEKKLLGALSALAFVILLIKYPKSTLSTIVTAGTILPTISYSSKSNEFFGISYGMALQIFLPKVDDETIIKDEMHLIELFEKWKTNQLSKAA